MQVPCRLQEKYSTWSRPTGSSKMNSSPGVNPVPQVMVLHEDDAVEADFGDGVSVRLSPCGANLALHDPLSQSKMVDHTHQKTQFVLSAHRRHVQTALDFRNRFAQRLFLCQEIHGRENVVDYYTEITTVTWPTTFDAVTSLEGGALQLTSIDECATMTLASNKQEFSIQFLCQMSNDSMRSHQINTFTGKHISNNTETASADPKQRYFADVTHKLNFDVEDEVSDLPSSNVHGNAKKAMSTTPCKQQVKEGLKRFYLWQVQHFSVEQCPENWRRPLELLKTVSRVSAENMEWSRDGTGAKIDDQGPPKIDTRREDPVAGRDSAIQKKLNSSVLPGSLPLRCSRSDLHHMTQIDRGLGSSAGITPPCGEEDQRVWMEKRRLKAFFSRGVLFRVFWKSEPVLEVYPGDGSVLRSMPGDGCYFTLFSCLQGSLREQVLSSKVPPPESIHCGRHSLHSLLQRSQRLLMHMKFIDRNTSSSPETVCWRSTDIQWCVLSRTPTHLIEECKVDGLGHFAAFSNGYIRVIFTDRTVLEFQIDMGIRTNKENAPAGNQRVAHIFPDDVGQVMLQDGTEAHVLLKNPGSLSGYVDPALQWAAWVLLPKEQRQTAYANTILDVRKIREINQELTRLQHFNSAETYYPVVQSGVHGNLSPVTTERGGLSAVKIQEVLGQTLAKIEDIENVLSSA